VRTAHKVEFWPPVICYVRDRKNMLWAERLKLLGYGTDVFETKKDG
jgi:hypothetical protein